MTQAVVETHQLTVRYDRKVAVNGVTLNLQPGEVLAVLGHNGSGKSSLLRSLLGLRRASSGRAFVFGQDAWRRRRQIMTRLAAVPEVPDLPDGERIAEACRLVAAVDRRWDESCMDHLLDGFRLDRSLRVGQLSRGQKTQLMLSLALAQRPELLILDDPTLGLDPMARRRLLDVLLEDVADRGTTVLLATHDLPEVETLATRIGVLHAGRLIVNETLESLKTRFRKIRVPMGSACLESIHDLAPIAVRETTLGSDHVISRLDEQMAKRFDRPDCAVLAMTLEEIFLAVVEDAERTAQGEAA